MVFTTMGVIAAAAIAGAVAMGTTAIVDATSPKPKGPDVPALPAAPNIGETAGEQRRKLNQQRVAGTDNVLTSPLGVSQAAETKKTLLG